MSIHKNSSGLLSRWNSMPLYWRILIALVAGLLTGIVLGKRALIFELPSKIILQLLGALAPPLILIAVTHVLMTTVISGKTARRLAGLLLLNTTVAILIGLGVANVLRPGSWSKLETPPAAQDEQTQRLDQMSFQMKLNGAMIATLKGDDLKSILSLTEEQIAKLDEVEKAADADRQKMFEEMRAAGGGGRSSEGFAQMQKKTQAAQKKTNAAAMAVLTADQAEMIEEMSGAKLEQGGSLSPVDVLVQNVPRSILGPLGDKSNVIGVIIIAIAFGVGLRSVKDKPINNVQDIVEVAYTVLLKVLHWIIALVPLGVFSIVAKVVGTQGFGPFTAMGAFIIAVIFALLLQTAWYLIRIRLFSWVRPFDALKQMRDSLLMAFSTSSSTATMPVTFACLKDKVGVREESASMGALVGANFNNDGTALYEAMSALFISQMLGQNLTLTQQVLVILTSIIASVGAAGIPEAGLVTMTLVFTAVGLPVEYIALLLTIDWFLDRCRTTINVLGDVNVSCLLDGKTRQATPVIPLAASPTEV